MGPPPPFVWMAWPVVCSLSFFFLIDFLSTSFQFPADEVHSRDGFPPVDGITCFFSPPPFLLLNFSPCHSCDPFPLYCTKASENFFPFRPSFRSCLHSPFFYLPGNTDKSRLLLFLNTHEYVYSHGEPLNKLSGMSPPVTPLRSYRPLLSSRPAPIFFLPLLIGK